MSAPRPSIGPGKSVLAIMKKRKKANARITRSGRAWDEKQGPPSLSHCTRAAGTIIRSQARPELDGGIASELPAGFFHRHVRAAETLTCPVLQGMMADGFCSYRTALQRSVRGRLGAREDWLWLTFGLELD
ncbi:uncharacterized protein FMAN_02300 [Fusarium mangiferae]|uniref:Uncharacterized protein n=1 Tax=Fusarium mangiferae TaxID=192010 RepID=A0A1L7TLB8_FUSMA|nr:uncharacterized protein FMAN_02300 [Fusarium mangiferae]CVK99460.1 uncharacterized protein FMAN_02300 [Fusarium mangiferae]